MTLRRAFSVSLFLSFLVTQPLTSFAASSDPASLLGALMGDTAPMEFHMTASSPGTTVWFNGMQEGNGGMWYKLKADMKYTSMMGGTSETQTFKVIAYHGKMYVGMGGKWASWAFEGMNPGSAMDSAYAAVSGTHGMTFVGSLWNAMFANPENLAMTETRFQGGHAYSLTLREAMKWEHLHIKIDTDNQGAFLHAKLYATDGMNAIEGKMQHSGDAVNVEVPSSTVSATDLFGWSPPSYVPMMSGDSMNDTQDGMMMKEMMAPDSAGAFMPYTVRSPKTDSNVTRYIPAPETTDTYVPSTDNSRPRALTRFETAPSSLTIPDNGAPFMSNLSQYEKSKKYQRLQLYLDRSDDAYPLPSSVNLNDPLNVLLMQPYTAQPFQVLRPQRTKFDKLTEDFADLAFRKDVYEMTSLLSRSLMERETASAVQAWLTSDIVPFFAGMDRRMPTDLLGIYQAKDAVTGEPGVVVYKSFKTRTGMAKTYVAFIVQENDYRPVIRDIYPNATPHDLGVMKGAVQVHANLDKYKPTISGLELAFDNRDWSLGYSQEADGQGIAEFVLPGQTVESWTELVTAQYFTNQEENAETYVNVFEQMLKKTCPNAEFTIVESAPGNIEAEWFGDCAPYMTQHEVMRVFKDGNTIYRLAYTVTAADISSGVRTVWLDLLKAAHVAQVKK